MKAAAAAGLPYCPEGEEFDDEEYDDEDDEDYQEGK